METEIASMENTVRIHQKFKIEFRYAPAIPPLLFTEKRETRQSLLEEYH
jgi:hypothetical protein